MQVAGFVGVIIAISMIFLLKIIWKTYFLLTFAKVKTTYNY